MMAGDRIIAEECQRANIAGDVMQRSKDPYLNLVRARIAVRLRNELQWSYPRIADKMQRDHSTVMNMVRRRMQLESTVKPTHGKDAPLFALMVIRRAHTLGYEGGVVTQNFADRLQSEFDIADRVVRELLHGRRYRKLPRPWLIKNLK